MKRIICIGNRYHGDDSAGARVYDCLSKMECPPDVEVIDGGLAGLDLLRFVESAERIVFADALLGNDSPERLAVLTAAEIAGDTAEPYGHAAGLPYLIHILPFAVEGPPPEIRIVGISPGANEHTIREAAELCLSLAVEGARSAHAATVEVGGATR